MAQPKVPPPPRSPQSEGVQYRDLLGGAAREGAARLLEHADELRRAQSIQEEERREIEARLAAGAQDRPILPVRDWVRNPYFVGELASDGPGGIYPQIKEHLEEIFEGRDGRGYFEVVLGGAISFGKTSGYMKGIVLRTLYELSCLAVPQRAFRSMQVSDSIILMNYNVTEKKARDTLYWSVRRQLESTPYFKDVGFLPEPMTKNEAKFPKNITMRPGVANATGAVSENLVAATLDEANQYVLVEDSERARARGETYDVADALHKGCFNRMRSRFMLPGEGGEMPRLSKLVVGSSAMYPEDFVERRCDQVAAGKVEHSVIVYRNTEWGTKPKHFYVKGWVPIAVSRDGGAEVLDGEDAGLRRVELEGRGWGVHDVPGEHVPSFRENPDLAVRELLGIATKAIQPFLRRREVVDQAFELRREMTTKLGLGPEFAAHPYTVVETTLRDAAHFIRDALVAKDAGGEWRPRVSPGAVRYGHVDLSQDRCGTGFVFGHVLDVREVQRVTRREDGGVEAQKEMAPWIWVDLTLRIVAPKDEQVDFASVRGLITELSGMGFTFGMWSWDQWQSLDGRQRLEEAGYTVDLVSLDRDPGPYIAMRRALYEGRLLAYEYEPLRSELLTIEDVKGKVLPARRNTKDVTDALAAMVHHCETLGMSGHEWADADSRMVLAPRARSARAPGPEVERVAASDPMLRGLPSPDPGAGEVGGAMFAGPAGTGPRAPGPAPDIYTRAYGRRRR